MARPGCLGGNRLKVGDLIVQKNIISQYISIHIITKCIDDEYYDFYSLGENRIYKSKALLNDIKYEYKCKIHRDAK